MDSSHLNPAAAQHPYSRDSSSDGHRGSHEPQHSTAGHHVFGPKIKKTRKSLVLCFDGTGNQFHGDSSDSNILKIFRMLDRSGGDGLHYYQPGIGTYVATAQLSARGSWEKFKNWYVKMKDAAVGTSFADHVVGGYKFLMQYYTPGDNIYMFGFSRGSYTARFLAEMIDWVGLITHGNEEMIQFAWRTFSKWKAIDSHDLEARRKQKKAYQFLVSFRETFSRPVRRIRFLGLFDTVNSVPRFENAILSRHRVPFSAISSAKIIRHAVSIDERRAKFRADLVSHGISAAKDTSRPLDDQNEKNPHPHHDWIHRSARYKSSKRNSEKLAAGKQKLTPEHAERHERRGRHDNKDATRYRRHSHAHSLHSQCSIRSIDEPNAGDNQVVGDASSVNELIEWDDNLSSDGEEDVQDIQELWFPGGHGDIGGGWDVAEGEVPLSHIPLVWIVHEAKKAGLAFDPDKMEVFDCLDDGSKDADPAANIPTIEVSTTRGEEVLMNGNFELGNKEYFHTILQDTAGNAMVHDCLRYNSGLSWGGTLRWKLMEYLPFRRLDLADDGKWKPIRWPLPRGEVRDMPDDAHVHISAIRRMQANSAYRPGNLILGGGGRGVIIAPKDAGIGEWLPAGGEGDFIRAKFVRKPKEKKEGGGQSNGESK